MSRVSAAWSKEWSHGLAVDCLNTASPEQSARSAMKTIPHLTSGHSFSIATVDPVLIP